MSAGRNPNNVLRFRPSQAKQKHQVAADVDHDCMNCGTRIQGNYCHSCGQAAHVHHSLLHLIEEMVHGLWHFDAKGWRTIPLLVAYPGELTRRYIDGQRVRFISPLGLYLFMVFLMFFAMSMVHRHDLDLTNANVNKLEATAQLNTKIATAKSAVSKAQQELDQAKKSGVGIGQKVIALNTAQEDEKALEVAVTTLNATSGDNVVSPDDFDKLIEDGPSDDKSASHSEIVSTIKATIKGARANPELLFYKMKSNAYKFALILVPLSMPFLWLMFFWRKNVTMFEHAVFCLYSLSFMALLVSTIYIMLFLGLTSVAGWMMIVIPPVHMYRQLKGTYLLTNGQTWWRTLVMMFAALLLMILYVVLVGALSLT